MRRPSTHYASAGGVHIAYQVIGDGPIDVLFLGSWINQIEHLWELPVAAKFLRRISSFSRLITLDKRGSGLSDRISGTASMEDRMDDVRAVMEAVGSRQAALFGSSEGGTIGAIFGATYPERTHSLILFGSAPRYSWAEDYPFGYSSEVQDMVAAYIENMWGSGEGAWFAVPGSGGNEEFQKWFGGFERLTGSPGTALASFQLNMELDIRDVLPVIRTPTLVIHRRDDPWVPVESGRFLAEAIAGAKYVELPGGEHFPFLGNVDEVADHVEEFLTGVRARRRTDRILATVLFTDVVGSTERAVKLGDRRWRELLDGHLDGARKAIESFDGRHIKNTGDGVLATFDGPTRAIRCAVDIERSAEEAGLSIRAGLHTGECELADGDVRGIAVHIADRIMNVAGAGEIVVSNTVKDLVLGTEIEFDDRGTRQLKGIPGEWRVFSVIAAGE